MDPIPFHVCVSVQRNCLYTHTHTHARTHARAHTHARTHSRTHTHTHRYARARAHALHSPQFTSTLYAQMAMSVLNGFFVCLFFCTLVPLLIVGAFDANIKEMT